jgi:hypothetical protein
MNKMDARSVIPIRDILQDIKQNNGPRCYVLFQVGDTAIVGDRYHKAVELSLSDNEFNALNSFCEQYNCTPSELAKLGFYYAIGIANDQHELGID